MLVLYLVWGSTYLGIAIAVDTIPPFIMASVRFLAAGLVLATWSIVREGRSFAMPSQREWRDSAIVGALLIAGGMGMVAFAEQTIPSGITALVVATMPLWVAILGGVFLGERLPRMAALGIVVGFVGVAILIGPAAFGGSGALDPIGLAAVLFSPIAWAVGSLFASHRATLPARPLVATALQMVMGGLVLGVMAGMTGEIAGFDPSAVSRDSFAAFLYLTVVGSLVAYTTFGWLLRVAPLPLVSTYAYVNPVVAVVLGSIILDEIVDARTIVAGGVIVFAVALIVTARGRLGSPRPTSPGLSESVEDTTAAAASPASASSPAPTPTR
jgi:drug/metabolite transporter (DMT)-like permease